MDKILAMLGIDKLDESKQAEIKTKFDAIVQLKVDEAVTVKETEIREQLTEQYEEKFEQYKNEITDKFSDFVDNVIDEEMEIPDSIIEYARKGELYEGVIEMFKTKLAIDEGLIDNEVKDLLKECKTTIEDQKNECNSLISENMELKKDAKEMAANLYIRTKCDGLPVNKTDKILGLLEGVYSQKEIDKKFDIVLETVNESKSADETDLNENTVDDDSTDLNEGIETDLNPFKKMTQFWGQQLKSK